MHSSNDVPLNRSILAAACGVEPKPESFEDRVLRENAALGDRLMKIAQRLVDNAAFDRAFPPKIGEKLRIKLPLSPESSVKTGARLRRRYSTT